MAYTNPRTQTHISHTVSVLGKKNTTGKNTTGKKQQFCLGKHNRKKHNGKKHNSGLEAENDIFIIFVTDLINCIYCLKVVFNITSNT